MFWTKLPLFLSSPTTLLIRSKHTLKTNKSVAKRFRRRGDGSLKRYKAGHHHNTGYLSRRHKNRLAESASFKSPAMERKLQQCMPK